MKRKLFGTLLAAALVVTSAFTVMAAGSKTSSAALTGETAQYYQITETFTDNGSYSEGVLDVINSINSGNATLDAVAKLAPELASELSGMELATKFQDLQLKEGEVPKNANSMYEPTITVPNLTDAMKDVKILHYSTVRSVWEIITPNNVDYSAKSITAEFQDLSPIAVLYRTDVSASAATADSAKGTSPSTGAESNWGMFAGAAAIFCGASAAAYRKYGKIQ